MCGDNKRERGGRLEGTNSFLKKKKNRLRSLRDMFVSTDMYVCIRII